MGLTWLIAHGGIADLPEVFSDCLKGAGRKGAGSKTELDDGYDVIDVQVVHVGLTAQFGFAGVDVAELLAVAAVDVHVVVVAFLVLLDEVGDTAENVLLWDGVVEANAVVVGEDEVVRDILLGSVGGEELVDFSP